MSKEVGLKENEQYRSQIALINKAALGYWRESDPVHAYDDNDALHNVARMYAKFEALRNAIECAMKELGVPQPGCPSPVAKAYEHLHEAFYYKPAKIEA